MEKPRPICPHCGQEMKKWATPQFSFSDGLGWGGPFLYVCFNDECPLYVGGWQSMMDYYGQNASYRCMCDPDSGIVECLPVFSPDAMKGDIIDEDKEAEEETARKEKVEEQKCLDWLQGLFNAKDAKGILDVLFNEDESPNVREKAADYLGELGDLNVIEPVRHYKFKQPSLQLKTDCAVEMIHNANYTKECPYCAEIVKSRAQVCKHCGKDI